jgi:hypothetical protein
MPVYITMYVCVILNVVLYSTHILTHGVHLGDNYIVALYETVSVQEPLGTPGDSQ